MNFREPVFRKASWHRLFEYLFPYTWYLILLKGIFCFFLFMYVIQHCFICCPSDSTVLEDAGIEPRTDASLALTARRSNNSAISHPHSAISHHHSARSHPHSARFHPHIKLLLKLKTPRKIIFSSRQLNISTWLAGKSDQESATLATYCRREGAGGNYLCGQSPTEEQEPTDTTNLEVCGRTYTVCSCFVYCTCRINEL